MIPLVVAAFSMLIGWTNPPGPVTGIEGRRCFSLNVRDMQYSNVWATADRTVLKLPGIPGQPDSGYVWCDGTPPAQPGEPIRYRIRFYFGTRWSESNDIIAQVGVRAPAEAQYFLARRDVFATCFTEPVWSEQGVVSWALAPGDSGRAEIVSKSYVDMTEQPHICGELLQFWSALVRARVCP